MNKKNSLPRLLFFLSCLFTVQAIAAPPIEEWVARYDKLGGQEVAVDIAVDANRNSYVTGYIAHYDWATAKYDASGNELWVKTYNGPGNGFDQAAAIAVNGLGNVYVTGSSGGLGTNYDYATIKYNTNGNVVWMRTYNAAFGAIDVATALALDSAGNVYVTGKSHASSCCGDDYLTIKYNANGTLLWAKRYDGPDSGPDNPTAVAVDSAGNVYVTGYSDGGTSSYDYATVKYSASGTQRWVKRYTGLATAPAGARDYPRGIAVDKNGNVIVTGLSGTLSIQSGDYATVKYSPAGSQLWAKRYDGPGQRIDEATAIATDSAGNVYISGASYGSGPGQIFTDYATIKYNPTGTQLWITRYNGLAKGQDDAKAIALDASGNVYVTGRSAVPGAFAPYDYATVKYNSNGAQQWVKLYDGPAPGSNYEDVPVAIAVDPSRNVYVTGWSTGNATGKDYATIKYVQP